jgi:hypothetical protein
VTADGGCGRACGIRVAGAGIRPVREKIDECATAGKHEPEAGPDQDPGRGDDGRGGA